MKKFIYYILTIITFIIILYSCLSVELQNDTFYTIKIGQLILNNGIDMKDHFSWISGLSYTYPHWFFDVIVAVVYNFFSFKGLYVLTYLLYGLVGLTLYFCLNKISNNKLLSIIITFISIILIREYAVLRAQLLSYSLIIMFYYNLLKLNSTGKRKYILYLVLISVILANSHVAVWPFLLVLFLPFIISAVIEKIINKKYININLYFDKYNLKLLLITFILVLLSGLLTPLGFVPYTYLINTMRGVTQSVIAEHKPIIIWYHKFLVVYIISLLLIIHNKKIKLNDIFLLLGLTIMMLSSRRHRILFILLSSFIVIKYFNIKKIQRIKLKNYKYFYSVVGISIIVLLIWFPLLYINYNKTNNSMISNSDYPIEAVKYIKNNLDYKNMKIFNEYNFGSYLIYNDIEVFIDSRADLYTKEFNNKYDYFIEYYEMNSNNYKKSFNKYDVDYVLTYKDSVLDKALINDKDFYKEYEDDYFIIYLKSK